MNLKLSDEKKQCLSRSFQRVRTENPRLPESAALIALLFWFVLLVSMLLQEVCCTLLGDSMPVRLALTAFWPAGAMAWCRMAERRSLRSMGLTKQHAVRQYLAGAAAGLAMLAAAVLCGVLAGAYAVQPGNASAGQIVLFGAVWAVQGFSEEIIFRGYLMMSLGGRIKPRTSVIFSAAVFAAAHLSNNGVTVTGILNVLLFGIAAGVLILRTDSIWAAAAMHGAWNFAQGNLFGIAVSGAQMGESALFTEGTGRLAWFGGGEFGAEGGLAASLVLVLTILLLLLWPVRKDA